MTDRRRLPLIALGRVVLALVLAVCPVARSTATSPSAVPLTLPTAPVEEHEEEKRPAQSEVEGEEAAPVRGDRRLPVPQYGILIPVAQLAAIPSAPAPLTRAAPADPFRNGLGTHFRC